MGRPVSVTRAWGVLVGLLVWVTAARGATYTWTGDGANDNWSNPSNWDGAAPANNETGVGLVFPALGGAYTSQNDRTGVGVTSLTITTQLTSGSYRFTGNAIRLIGAVSMASPGSGTPNLLWQIAVILDGDVTISTSGRQTQLQGAIDLGSHTLTLDADDGDIVLAGVVSGTGNLVKNNGAALTITGANTYTGATTGNGGALYIADAAAFGASATGTTFNSGFLGFAPGSTFAIAEPFVFNGGRILAYGAATMTGPVTLNATIDIQAFEAPTFLTINASIGGSGGLNKTGPGRLILNAASNPYAGATAVIAGTLQLDAALISSSPVTVKDGATLNGNGSSGGTINLQDGGTLAPGSSPGGLNSAGLTMVAGATLAAEIAGPNPVTQYDRMSVSGPVSLEGATLAVALGYEPSDGEQFTLISQLQGQPVNGTFAGLGEGATFQIGGTTFAITYQGGSGHDVVLVAGPTGTPVGTASSTPTRTATSPPTPPATTPPVTPTPTPSSTPSPTASAMALPCSGDCDGDHVVEINELVLGVNIALDKQLLDSCPDFDADGNDRVSVAELVAAVGRALRGCTGFAR
jgi:autotransporter-associated beta strand protein